MEFLKEIPNIEVALVIVVLFAGIFMAYVMLYRSIKKDQRTPEQIETDAEILAANAFVKATTNEPLS
jgi:hypothetical protein